MSPACPFSHRRSQTHPSWCVCVCPNARIPSMRDCGSVALSGHRSLHLPASRGGFQEMPQVVAVQEIPPDYNQRLYKDTAHWSTSVLSVKKKCRSVTLRLHLFILLVTIPVRCGPCAPMWSTTGRSRPCGRAFFLSFRNFPHTPMYPGGVENC